MKDVGPALSAYQDWSHILSLCFPLCLWLFLPQYLLNRGKESRSEQPDLCVVCQIILSFNISSAEIGAGTLHIDLHTVCPYCLLIHWHHLSRWDQTPSFFFFFNILGYPSKRTAIKLCSLLMVAGLLNCPEARAGLPRSRSLGEGNSLCLGTGPFPLVSVKPGVKLSQEQD